MKIDNNLYLISRIRESANNFIISEIEKLGIKGLAPSHGDIIVTLFKYKNMTMTQMAESIHRDRSTVTTLVNKLVKLGYVDTMKNPEDSRSSIVYLTNKGKELEEDFKRISTELISKEYRGIDDDEREIFLKILNKIQKNLADI
jgi:DNA-binding MarR family transcriptional regulator